MTPELSAAEIFWSGVVIGAVVMAALISLAQTVAEEVRRLEERQHQRRTALPTRRW